MNKYKSRSKIRNSVVLVFIFSLLGIGPLYAQQVVVGKIVDNKGLPIPMVNILIKGSTIGTLTSIEGDYSLQIPTDQKAPILVFSSIGFLNTEELVGTRTTINLILEDAMTTLDDVVVVGYGTQKKVNLTGAVSAMKVDEKLAGRALSSVSSGMAGMIPGLSASQSSGMAGNNSANLIIRGLGTINNSSPLIVVDDMPDVDINRINMNDIESISVLKDATSASVYGSRGANGVILIKTKSGKGQERTSINFSSSFGFEKPTKAYSFMADYPRSLSLYQNLQNVNNYRSNFLYKDGTIDE